MCFSATAGYTAATVLLPLGSLNMWRAWRDDRRYVAPATLPLLFGVQQLFEGLVWSAGDGLTPDDDRKNMASRAA